MSDAGGSPNQVNTVFTLDDSAATPLPDTFPGVTTDNRTDSRKLSAGELPHGPGSLPGPGPGRTLPDPGARWRGYADVGFHRRSRRQSEWYLEPLHIGTMQQRTLAQLWTAGV